MARDLLFGLWSSFPRAGLIVCVLGPPSEGNSVAGNRAPTALAQPRKTGGPPVDRSTGSVVQPLRPQAWSTLGRVLSSRVFRWCPSSQLLEVGDPGQGG
jgi:hypothetical protein